MRHRTIRVVAPLATLVAVLSCGGADGLAPTTSANSGEISSDSALLAGLTASGPVVNGYVAVDRIGASHSVTPSADASWVSLVPRTVPDGATATIINLRTAQRVSVPIVDGGFDPRPITASLGDTIQVSVSRAGKPDAAALLSIAARPAPRIVRTQPLVGETEAPLNPVITLVFSEPLDPASVNATSITLTTATTHDPLAGDLRMLRGSTYAVELTPSALLEPSRAYSLAVNGVRNLAGTLLAATPTFITFTTGRGLGGDVSSVRISPDSVAMSVGGVLKLTVVVTDPDGQSGPDGGVAFWTSSAPDVAIADGDGLLIALGIGTAEITAKRDGHVDTMRVTVSPSTAPVGQIATSRCIDVVCGIYAVDPDGSNGRFLTTSWGDYGPAWSPDGTYIAFPSLRACDTLSTLRCHGELYVTKADGSGVKSDGSGVRSPTRGSGLDVGVLSWSPGGDRIAFGVTVHDNLDAFVRGDLYVVNADGSGLRLLVSGPPGGSAWVPSWSPDGSKIAYVVAQNDSFAINVVNSDGSNTVRISKPSASNGDDSPNWSPDGKRIAFSRLWLAPLGASGGSTCQVFVMDADGSNATQLTHDSFCSIFPTWSPDGSRMALQATFAGKQGLGVMNADGSGGVTILPPYGLSGPSWRRRANAPSLSAQTRVKP